MQPEVQIHINATLVKIKSKPVKTKKATWLERKMRRHET